MYRCVGPAHLLYPDASKSGPNFSGLNFSDPNFFLFLGAFRMIQTIRKLSSNPIAIVTHLTSPENFVLFEAIREV